MEKKELFSTLFIAVITAVITSALTVWVNKVAFDDTKRQAQYEHKVKAIETFSKIAMNMIILFRSMDKIHLQENDILIDSVKERHSPDPFYDIKKSPNITSKTNAFVDNIMKKQDTALYHNYQKASAYLSDYFSAYYSSVNFFASSTQGEFGDFNKLMQPDSYQDEVRQVMRTKKTTSLKLVNIGDIDDSLWIKRTNSLKSVLRSMSDLN